MCRTRVKPTDPPSVCPHESFLQREALGQGDAASLKLPLHEHTAQYQVDPPAVDGRDAVPFGS